MIDALKQAFVFAAQQSDEEQAALADLIMRAIDGDARWEELFADPLTPELLDLLAAESLAEDRAGKAKEIKGAAFLS